MLPKNKKERGEFRRGLMFLSQIGINIIACILVGVLLGSFLDRFFGTSPWILLLFSLLGMGAAFKSIFDLTMRK